MATNGTAQERSALVLYGTETGTSQDLAEELERVLERLHFSTVIGELDSFSPTQLTQYTVTVFVLSTTGQGEFPSNSRKFWTSLLRRKLGSSFLKGVEFALVGLGDSSYPKFNWAARKLGKRLEQLGAEGLIEDCEADEQGDDSTDGAFLAWSQQFRSVLLSKFPLSNGVTVIPDDVRLPSKWRLNLCQKKPAQNGHPAGIVLGTLTDAVDQDNRPIPGSNPATLISNHRVTPPDHWQDVRLIRLHLLDHVEYFPGDALSILPKNSPIDVQILIDLMGWNEVADLQLQFKPSPKVSEMVKPGAPPVADLREAKEFSLRGLLVGYLDIKAIPRRSFFAAIAPYTDNDMHKERLLEFTNPEYLDEYYDYATRPRRSILEILQEFNSVKIPYEEAANILPVMRPRQFSIASGGALKHTGGGTTFELLIAIVKYRTVIKRIREGVCTRYLAMLASGSNLNVVLKTESRFYPIPTQIPQNHLLIGPGTGVAPLRALIHEKQALSLKPQSKASSTLIFGSRSSDADYFFKNEWKELFDVQSRTGGASLQVITAFSRDQKAKVYVQDRIREHTPAIRQLLDGDNATVIVCGSSGQMPKAVRGALVDVLTSKDSPSGHLIHTTETAEAFLANMEKTGRYKQETW